MRQLVFAAVVFSAVAAAQDLRPSFDAASIKPAAPMPVGGFLPGSRLVCPLSGCGGPGTVDPGRIRFVDISLKNLIQTAYDVRP